MAKRSPILGYNHNVLYRGIVFHVQTEDSGLLSPHLFTHLFHSGVIISTRKLVYDAGSDEGAIKSLMQAQHKAVMKGLKRGEFDDKIDQYLGGTPGLLPRGAPAPSTSLGEQPLARPSEPALDTPLPVAFPSGDAAAPSAIEAQASAAATSPVARPQAEIVERNANVTQPIDVDVIDLVPPIAIARTATPPPIPVVARTATPPPIPVAAKTRADTEIDRTAPSFGGADDQRAPVIGQSPRGALPRTQTAERTSPSGSVRQAPPGPPAPEEIDAPTLNDASAASIAAAIAAANAHTASRDFNVDSSPEIEIQLELDEPDDEPSGRRRARDTDVATADQLTDGVPSPVGVAPSARTQGDSVPPLPPPPASQPYVPPQRPSSVVGASLPAARPVTRPPSRQQVTAPPGVISRPVTPENPRARNDSDVVEVYAPAPPSVEPPPGAQSERPGQYAQHRRPRISTDKSGQVPIPAGLGRPGRASINPIPTPAIGVPRTGTPSQPPVSPAHAHSGGIPTPVAPHTTEPIASRTATANRTAVSPSRTASSSGGVVMTRPAVIVGAPAKQTAALPRVRKAREDEGRGFGQGLISEKSLDEVILAYLSEDADDK